MIVDEQLILDLDPVESLTVRLGQLELTITVRQVDHNTGPLPAITVVPPGSHSAGYQVSQNTWNHSALAPSYPRGLDQAALASDRPRDLAALDLRFLGALTNQLTGSARSGVDGRRPFGASIPCRVPCQIEAGR